METRKEHGGAGSSGGHGGTGSSGSQGDDRRSQGGPDEDRRDLEHAVPGGTQVAPYKWWAEGEQRGTGALSGLNSGTGALWAGRGDRSPLWAKLRNGSPLWAGWGGQEPSLG